MVGRFFGLRWRQSLSTSRSQGLLHGNGETEKLDLGEFDVIIVVRDGEELLRHLDVLERRFSVHHLVENAAQRPHIARAPDLFSIPRPVLLHEFHDRPFRQPFPSALRAKYSSMCPSECRE